MIKDLTTISTHGFVSTRLGAACVVLAVLLSIAACGGDETTSGPTSFVGQEIVPVEECKSVKLSGQAELDATYTKIRSMHFYRYGNGHPFCEATSHIVAHEGVIEHNLPMRKLIIKFTDIYRNACRREPEFAWHTVAALPSTEARGGYLVLDPVYLCGIEDLSDYLDWYVRSDCPEFADRFSGCVSQTEEDWMASVAVDSAAHCVLIDTPPWHYDLFNCSYNMGEPWDEARLARAFSYIRTDLTGSADYGARPGASINDYGCEFDGAERVADREPAP